MSKRIFELHKHNPGVIIDRNKESFMQHDPNYVKGLEELVLKLIPIYDRYYDLTGAPKPPLESQVIKSVVKKQPALFQSWPLRN